MTKSVIFSAKDFDTSPKLEEYVAIKLQNCFIAFNEVCEAMFENMQDRNEKNEFGYLKVYTSKPSTYSGIEMLFEHSALAPSSPLSCCFVRPKAESYFSVCLASKLTNVVWHQYQWRFIVQDPSLTRFPDSATDRNNGTTRLSADEYTKALQMNALRKDN